MPIEYPNFEVDDPSLLDSFTRWQQANSLLKESSFSGTSLHVGFVIPPLRGQPTPKVIEATNVQTISYSTLRTRTAVRALGEVAPKGWVGGSRTVAGSIITTMFQFDPLYEYWVNYMNEKGGEKEYSSPFYDDLLPPFTIVIDGHTELGQHANMAIRNVRIANTGMTMSVDDLLVEKQFTYVADWVEPFVSRGEWASNLRKLLSQHPQATRLSDLVEQPVYRPQELNKTKEAALGLSGQSETLVQ